ncbi:hypothetical protein [Planktotalea sp.]|uniref:hypothetical protein n=1 Tax=Planktotalea sp. TaxID=2029877 RepID=UPI003D6AF725
MTLTSNIAPYIALLCLVLGAASLGIYPVKKLIQVKEAKHELKHGSAGFLRTMSGWIIIALWIAAVWFFATIIGDWWAFGNLEQAIARSFHRLELLLHILAALADD